MSKKPSNNEPPNLDFYEMMSHLMSAPPAPRRVDEEPPCPEHAIRVLSEMLAKQGLMVVDADGLQHVVREVFLDGWHKYYEIS